VNDPDGTSPNETPAGEASPDEPSRQDGDRELSAGGPGTEEKRQSATPETDFDWLPHPSVSELPELEDDTDPFYGRIRDRLLQNRPFQFSLATMFWITAGVAIVFSSARASGRPYDECLVEMFFWIYIPIYLVGPAVIVLVSSWAKTKEGRLLVGGVTAAVIVVPGLIMTGCLGGAEGILPLIVGTVFIWGFEALVIVGIRRGFDASDRIKRRP